MSRSKILVLGKGGQLSNALAALLGERALIAGMDEANFLDQDFTGKLEKWLGSVAVAAVMNAGAYTQVDACETTGRKDALRINATAVGELAAWCKKRGLPLVHFSTDYVFDGSGTHPWREDNTPHPLNAYGKSKLAGEKLLAEGGGKYLLFRTSWLYDATGKNFFTTMRRLFKEKESLNVVSDQHGAPTYVPHLAKATMEALDRGLSMQQFPGGIYHLCSGGETTWYGFAQAIFEREKKREPDLKCRAILPIPTSAYPLPAPRPLNSRLDCSRIRERFGIVMPRWEEGLRECIEVAS